jgi:hypothetical protein
MIRHIVMWTLHQAIDAPYFKAQLESCRQLVPGLLELEVGLQTEGLEGNCHVVLNSLFAAATALEAYQKHPHHLVVKANVGKLVLSRCVLDYNVD